MKKFLLVTASFLFLSLYLPSCKVGNHFSAEGQGSSAEIVYSATQSVMYESIKMFGFARAADRLYNGDQIERAYLNSTFFAEYDREEERNGDLIFSSIGYIDIKYIIKRDGKNLYEEGTEWKIVRESTTTHDGKTYSPIYTVKCTGDRKWTVSQDRENGAEYYDVVGASDFTVTLWEVPELAYDCYYVINGKCFYHSIDNPDYFTVDAVLTDMMVYSVLEYGLNMRSGRLDATVYNDGVRDIIETETKIEGSEKVIILVKNGVKNIIRQEI